MHVVRFFPIGNADTCLIELENGRRALFDFADMRNPDNQYDLRCDLEQELRDCLGDDKEIDVVAFTHLDTDHCARAKEVFHLEHAEKYQGEGRIKIKTMWVTDPRFQRLIRAAYAPPGAVADIVRTVCWNAQL